MSKIRFCSQRDNYSCVPVAILNAIKWSGLPASYNELFPSLKSACATTRDGTSKYRLVMVLEGLAKHCDWTVQRLYKPNVDSFERHISHPNRAAIICYDYWDVKEWDWIRHCSFWPSAYQKGRRMVYAGINDSDIGHYWFRRNRVKKILRPRAKPEVWLLTRCE